MSKAQDHLKQVILVLILGGCLFLLKGYLTAMQDLNGAITLTQAIDAAYPAARKWSPNAELVYAISTETRSKNRKGNEGMEGKHAYWNVVFIDPINQRNLLVALENGKPRYTEDVLMAFHNPINIKSLRFDSPQALKLISGPTIPTGLTSVHYELINQTHPVLRVYFLNDQGRHQIVSLDEITGQILK